MNFKNKVVWITGASSGIGEALAYAFAQQGAKLILSARKEKELLRVKEGCNNNPQVIVQPLDVGIHDDIDRVMPPVFEQMGGVDIVVINAGISQRDRVVNTAIAVDKKIMDVNYFGAIACAKIALPTMLQQGSGHLVVTSSVMGKFGTPWRSAYSASKHALHGYFDSLRGELYEDNIDVTIICPGYVNTNVTINALKGDGGENAKKAAATAKGMKPDDFAAKAIRAIAKKKKEVLIGGKEIYAVYLKRFFPTIFANLVKNVKVKEE